jgi:hypothetical protein
LKGSNIDSQREFKPAIISYDDICNIIASKSLAAKMYSRTFKSSHLKYGNEVRIRETVVLTRAEKRVEAGVSGVTLHMTAIIVTLLL